MLQNIKDSSKKLLVSTKQKALSKTNSLLNSTKSKEKYIVALDIGTEYVKALIARSTADSENLEIIGVGKSHQKLTDMQSGAISDIAGVVENCDKALSEAEEQAKVSARSVVIGIAGELVKGMTNTVKISRKDPTIPIDAEEMDKIITLVQQKSENRAKQQLAYELGGKNVDVRLVNSALVSIEIDGYPISNPIGFQGRDVVIGLYTAFAPMIHIGALEKTAQELDLDLIAVAAEPFAVSRAVIGNDPNQNLSAILMDVGGGTTDIAVINEGGVQGTKMFGIGGRAYTRSIERELGITFDQAEKIKLNLSSNQIPTQKRPIIELALEKTADTWVSGVELGLSEFDKLDNLPYRMFLCGGGSSLDLLLDTLEQTDWYKNLPFTKKPVVHHIRPEQVIGIVDRTGSINDHTFITAMGLLRVGMDTIDFDPNASDSIKAKLDKILSI